MPRLLALPLVALACLVVPASSSGAATTLTHAVITTDLSFDAECTYPDVDPCDDNTGGWSGQSLDLEQRSSAVYRLRHAIPADEMDAIPLFIESATHSYTATEVYEGLCKMTVTATDSMPSGDVPEIVAGFSDVGTTDPMDPQIELRTGRSYDLDGVHGSAPTVKRTTETKVDNTEACTPGTQERTMPFTEATDPLVDVFGNGLDYAQAVNPQQRAVECAGDVCSVRVSGGETWTITGKAAAAYGNVTATYVVSWELGFSQGAQVCGDGIDNDGDGTKDYPEDPGCASEIDPTELGHAECDNGIDDDENGFTDWRPAGARDPGCDSLSDTEELSEPCVAASAQARHVTMLHAPARLVLANLPDTDLGTLHLRVPWCMTNRGPRIGDRPAFTSGPDGWWDGTDNWALLGALESFAGVTVDPLAAAVSHGNVSATVSGSLRANLDAVSLVLSAVPLGKLFKPLKKALSKHSDELKPLARRLKRFDAKLSEARTHLGKATSKLRETRAKLAANRFDLNQLRGSIKDAVTAEERERLERELASLLDVERGLEGVERGFLGDRDRAADAIEKLKADEGRTARQIDAVLKKARHLTDKVAGFKTGIMKAVDDKVDGVRPKWARAIVLKLVDRFEQRLDEAIGKVRADIRRLSTQRVREALMAKNPADALVKHLRKRFENGLRALSDLGVPLWDADMTVSFDRSGTPTVADNSKSHSIFTVLASPTLETTP